MVDAPGAYSHFRLNLEQQRKRAKELLKSARAGDARAILRFRSPPTLAEAQYLIARDLRFADWSALKHHIEAMARESVMVRARDDGMVSAPAIDGAMRTLHVRCGSDIRDTLGAAGFDGDFREHSYPYLIGPVREEPGYLEERARFLVENYADAFEPPLRHEQALRDLERDEALLAASADYDRVVIWSEPDCYDQLVLVRLLGHYATHARPGRMELVNVGGFPGAARFIGLGQLPPEALRLLWATRTPATPAVLQLGRQTWRALVDPDPGALAAIMRSGTPDLPLLAPALHRHLRELPSRTNGLSFTEEMALRVLDEEDSSLIQLIGRQVFDLDPLPGQGDLNVRNRVLAMERADALVFIRCEDASAEGDARPPWTDRLSITELGRAILRGEVDFRSLNPPPRWVGGVAIGRGLPDWRWDDARCEVVRLD